MEGKKDTSLFLSPKASGTDPVIPTARWVPRTWRPRCTRHPWARAGTNRSPCLWWVDLKHQVFIIWVLSVLLCEYLNTWNNMKQQPKIWDHLILLLYHKLWSNMCSILFKHAFQMPIFFVCFVVTSSGPSGSSPGPGTSWRGCAWHRPRGWNRATCGGSFLGKRWLHGERKFSLERHGETILVGRKCLKFRLRSCSEVVLHLIVLMFGRLHLKIPEINCISWNESSMRWKDSMWKNKTSELNSMLQHLQ